MTEEREELRVFAVELRVECVAVVTVPATSSDEACELAEKKVRPVDVTELAAVEVERVVEVKELAGELEAAAKARARESRAKGSKRGREV